MVGTQLTRKQALTDVPAFFAPELAAAYPDAKFILTWRETDAW